MNDDPVTFEYYKTYLNALGFYDPFDIKLQYKLYLATQTGDAKIIEMEMRSYYYNMYYKAIGKLN